MEANLPLLTADDLDAMSPDERLAAFQARVITNLDELPVELRERIEATARQLGEARRSRK